MSKKFNLVILILLVGGCSSISSLKKFNPPKGVNVAPGEVIKIPTSSEATSVKCVSKVHQPMHVPSGSYFVYAESYFSKGEAINCEVFAGNGKILYRQKIVVSDKEYPFETLSVNPRRVKLNKKDLQRVLRERKLLNKIYGKTETPLGVEEKFELPLRSKVTSNYGTRRLFNNVKKSQHLGIDFRAKVGVPIPASNKGKVVFSRDLFYTGNTVIIDHGLGIFTLYGHLNKLTVSENQTVNKGDIVGHAGKTGRVTGPHLHWGVKVNGHWVDGFELSKISFP